MESVLQIHAGPYKGDVSALCLLPAARHHEYPLLLAGTGSELLLYDMGSFELLLSQHVFEGIRVHGIEVPIQSPGPWLPLEHLSVFTTLAVHGERTVKLYSLTLIVGAPDGKDEEKQIHLELYHKLPRFKHWIMDVRFLKEIRFAGEGDSEQLLAVGTSDNSVYLWSSQSRVLIHHVECAERCLLYSMRMWGDDPETLMIAAGTIYNEIIVWDLGIHLSSALHVDGTSKGCFAFKRFGNTAPPKRRLKGHEGSIFRISWSEDGKKVASVSDDRSLRVWIIEREACESSYQLSASKAAPTERDFDISMYGHTARIWDCHIDKNFLTTVSEDCTYRVWANDGKPLAKETSHLGRGIWRCVYDPKITSLITAGSDSSIKVHSLFKTLSDLNKSEEGGEPTALLESFSIELQEAVHGKRDRQLDSKSEYVRCLYLVDPACLYVGTNQGSLRCVLFAIQSCETWIDMHSNLDLEPIVCLDILRLGKQTQDNGHEETKRDWIVMGDGKGYVTILCVSWIHDAFHKKNVLRWRAEGERKLLGVYWSESLGPSFIFTSDPCGALFMWRLGCITGPGITTLQEESAHDGPAHFVTPCEDTLRSSCVHYQSSFNARIVCVDALPEQEILICGDQRGNITVFLLSFSKPIEGSSCCPLATFKGAHGISTVASLRAMGSKNKEHIKICSTGRDGCICTFDLEKSSGKLTCLRVEKLSAVTIVESCVIRNGITKDSCARVLAAGFTAVDFLICDLHSDCEIARVSCGGWRRPYSYLIGGFPEVQYCFVFVKDGKIHVYRKWFVAHVAASPTWMLSVANRGSFLSSVVIRSQFHGREIHSVNLIAMDRICEMKCGIRPTSWIATGAEDGAVRMMRFNEGTLEHFDAVQVLGEHVGGSAVRAVTSVTGYSLCSEHGSSTQDGSVSPKAACLLISVGAKEVMTCWSLEWEDVPDSRGQQSQVLSSRWLNTKRPSRVTKPSKEALELGDAMEEDDHRYLAVSAFSVYCPETRSQACFTVTASSNATIMFHGCMLLGGNWVDLCVLEYHKAPVLTLQHLVLKDGNSSGGRKDKYMVFSGATDGSIGLWDVTDIVIDFCHNNVGHGPEKVYRPLSGRGSQGGRRWKLYRRQRGGQQVKQASGGHKIEMGPMDSKGTFKGGLVIDHPNEGFPYPCSLEPELVLPNAHQSGVNSLAVSTLKNEKLTKQDKHTWLIVSGGDDQAMHIAILASDKTSSNEESKAICLMKASTFSAHSSAIKGVWTDGSLIVSTGLDQRLRCWQLDVSWQDCSLVECSQRVTNVPEPAALHVEHFNGKNYRVAVVGRGLQIFEVRGEV